MVDGCDDKQYQAGNSQQDTQAVGDGVGHFFAFTVLRSELLCVHDDLGRGFCNLMSS